MSGEDAPRPYPEDLIVPEIKTNKQSTGTHDAAADSGHCSVRYLRPEDELPPDLLWSELDGVRLACYRSALAMWPNIRRLCPSFWDCVPCWTGSMHASTGNELRRCIRPSWQQRLSPCVADHGSARAFARRQRSGHFPAGCGVHRHGINHTVGSVSNSLLLQSRLDAR